MTEEEKVRKGHKSILASAMIAVFVALSVCLPELAAAGDLEPPAIPDDDAGAMYTIEDLYDYLDTGVAGAKRTGGFAEPVSGPGSTGRTLDEVHAKIAEKCITCEGTLTGTRWCDQGDGTVKDMITGLVWLKDASWGGAYPWWASTIEATNAHDRAAQLKDGVGGLTDGSVEGDWRLPAIWEFRSLIRGTERVHCSAWRAFTGLQCTPPLTLTFYWSSTPFSPWGYDSDALCFSIYGDGFAMRTKDNSFYVWPVRSDN